MENDYFGKDPTVRAMRRVFGLMEAAQNLFLENMGISPLDSRLRAWRDRARRTFERSWAEAAERGNPLDEIQAASQYVGALTRVLASDGIEIPEGSCPARDEIGRLVREGGL